MRAFWFAAGTAAGVYATTKARRAAEALTVDGIHDRLTGWFAGARVLGDELRHGAHEKETELRGRLALVPDGTDNVRQLTARSDDTTDGTSHVRADERTGKGDS